MEDIEQRLKDTTETCIANYVAWKKDQKDEATRENLAEAIHEMRKVASRLEIEIAVSEREQMANKPIAIPPHRSSRKGAAVDDGAEGDDIGNAMPDDNGANGNGGPPRRGGGKRGGGGRNRRGPRGGE